MDDNAWPHRTLAVEELLESEDITRMDWPAYSPDLNPIEHMWDALGRRIAARLHHPENTQQLKQILIEEWALLPQEMLHQLVLSFKMNDLSGSSFFPTETGRVDNVELMSLRAGASQLVTLLLAFLMRLDNGGKLAAPGNSTTSNHMA
ncbi:transposable element Tc1 transposase [Trichonephila clavipes]|nr:transposable element Tc1 transposase [Trichonephila clavipes]